MEQKHERSCVCDEQFVQHYHLTLSSINFKMFSLL